VVATWGLLAFVQTAMAALRTLPLRVAHQLATEGEPFTPLRDVSPYLVEATVAVEDRSFWVNPGVSVEGILRAAVVDLLHGAFVQGGSTITQQLVRDELLGYQKSLHRKLEEIGYALLCTRMYSKREILALYLNEVNYGHGALGIRAASEAYFGLPPADLDLAQSALLAGIPQDPEGLDPYRHPAAARARREVVLQAMVATHAISPAEARAAAATPLGLLPYG
jgi:membrane peptidoglycan carboxypeptidase